MPMVNGYSIYVGGEGPFHWLVRAYRDADDKHIHSAEECTLLGGLREVADAILADQETEAA